MPCFGLLLTLAPEEHSRCGSVVPAAGEGGFVRMIWAGMGWEWKGQGQPEQQLWSGPFLCFSSCLFRSLPGGRCHANCLAFW